MSLLTHALSPRWLGYLALCVAFAVVTSLFGLWQWDRRGAAVAEIDRVETNYDAPAVPLGQIVGTGWSWDDDVKWRPVSLRGEYLASEALLVRTRPRFGAVGFDVVVPFRLEGGQIVLINRGWVPTGTSSDMPDEIPAPPTGTLDVLARLLPSEPQISGRTAPPGQVATINLSEIAALTALDLDTRFYLALEEEAPGAPVTPLLLERPTLDEGPHLSYTFQWFLFGLLAFFAWGYLLREDYRRTRGISPAPTLTKQPTDQDVEDALVDLFEGR